MDNIVFLKGNRIHLRSLMEQDLSSAYLQWLNDEEVCRNNSHAVFPNTEAKMKAYFNSLQNTQRDVVLAIVHTESGTHIGNVSLQNINWVSRNAEFAILIGDRNYWGGGYGTEAAQLIVAYGFERLNLHRIYCGTMQENEGMKKLASVLNMRLEGERREAVYKNGRYHNILEYGVLKAEFTGV
ncbi:GNAT family N-acetyltransferase [Flavisolibacter sp. BT320]|nr:GNAT family N-acetyltransferase [Flavisolibacter longurius]